MPGLKKSGGMNKHKIFLDTGFFIRLLDANDHFRYRIPPHINLARHRFRDQSLAVFTEESGIYSPSLNCKSNLG